MPIEAVYEAARLLRAKLEPTPMVEIPERQRPAGPRISLKLECRQRSGSFKARGAFHFVSRLLEAGAPAGVVTYSSGNHGRAVAEAARDAGVAAIVTVPDHVDPSKARAIRDAGAEVVLAGPTSESREIAARRLAKAKGYAVIPPFDHEWIIAGQGTVALEILEAVPNLAGVWVPVGGGGLASGIATVLSALRPEVPLYAVEPENAASLGCSLRKGFLTELDRAESVADGLLPIRVGELNWALLSRARLEAVRISEKVILDTLGFLHRTLEIHAEPSGAVAPAPLFFPEACGVSVPEGHHVAVVSGGNVDAERLASLLEKADPVSR